MADPDKSLLDRLKALKPSTGVALPGHEPPPGSKDITSAKPAAAKSDALTDRLRSLRERAEHAPPHGPASGPRPGAGAAAQPRPADTTARASPSSESAPHAADYDGLLETDDGFLEDLLQGEDAELAPQLSLDARAELDALRELSRQFSELVKVQETEQNSDDSGGEEMRRGVEEIVSEAVAGVESGELGEGAPVKTEPGGEPEAETDTPRDPGDEGDPALSLPSVPTDLPSPTTSPPEDVPNTGSFDDDMARRMAALKNFKPSQPASNPLDLPSVPTFHPKDRAPAETAKPAGRVGFTDDDMETWCTVCLEDGALICPGCDDDVYCSRCWYEMHRGPMAGYEETTHEAKQFNRDQKRKKVAVGA